MQDLDVLGTENFFLFCTLLRVSKQGIGSSVSLALIIVNLKVVTKGFLGPANLSEAQTLCAYEPTKVVMVGEYKHLMVGAFCVMSPGLESFNDG